MPGEPSLVSFPEPKLYRDTVFAIVDSGAPTDSTNYTTIVLIHGAGTNGANFHRFLPLAASHNARVVLLNRRDYRGSVPIPREEVDALAAAGDMLDDAARAVVLAYKRARSREFYDFLCAFVQHERIPLPQPQLRTQPPSVSSDHGWGGRGGDGGLVITGWSAGNMLVTGLLANIADFAAAASDAPGSFDLRPYISHAVLYDGPHRILGYVPSLGCDGYNPFFDPSVPAAAKPRLFSLFASGYYDHGALPAGVFEDRHFEDRQALAEPRPTVLDIPDSERALTSDPGPMRTSDHDHESKGSKGSNGGDAGSELTVIGLGKRFGTFAVLKDGMLYLDGDSHSATAVGHNPCPASNSIARREASSWDNLPIHVVWGERSVWEAPKAAWEMQKEVEAGRRDGKRMRKVAFTMVKGGNHFVSQHSTLRQIIRRRTLTHGLNSSIGSALMRHWVSFCQVQIGMHKAWFILLEKA